MAHQNNDTQWTPLGQKILSVLKSKDTNINKFCKDVKCARTKIYKLLTKDTLSLTDASFMCTMLGVSPEAFGLPVDYLKTQYNQQVENTKDVQILSFNTFLQKHPEKDRKEFLDQYYNLFDQFIIQQMTSSLSVLDYCAKERGLENKYHADYYHELNQKYYKALERKISNIIANNQSFTYNRFFQLPLDVERYTEIDTKVLKHRRELPFKMAIRIVVELMFDETFEHIWNCFVRFEKSFKLNVLKLPVRFFNVYIADNKSIISEYDRCNLDRDIFPDIIFAEAIDPLKSSNDFVQNLIDTHQMDIDKLVSSKKKKGIDLQVSKEQFIKALLNQERYIKKTIKSIKEKRKKLKAKLDKIETETKSDDILKLLTSQTREVSKLEKLEDDLKFWKKRKEKLNRKLDYVKQTKLNQ